MSRNRSALMTGGSARWRSAHQRRSASLALSVASSVASKLAKLARADSRPAAVAGQVAALAEKQSPAAGA
jgi:hypothetical protein